MSITRLPWHEKPQHDHGVWYRIRGAEGQFIGTARGKDNAPKLFKSLLNAIPYLPEPDQDAAVELIKSIMEPQ